MSMYACGRAAPRGAGGEGAVLTLSAVDPEADFSYDYHDLAFTRVRDCR